MEKEFFQILQNQLLIMECMKYFVTFCVEHPNRLLAKLENRIHDTNELFAEYTREFFEELKNESQL